MRIIKKYYLGAAIIVILLVVSLSGILGGNQTITFQGEGEHWQARLKQESWEEDGRMKSRDNFHLSYMGSDPEELGMVTFEVKASPFPQAFIEGETSIGIGVYSTSGGGTGTPFTRDQVITVTVEWDGKTETFELHGS